MKSTISCADPSPLFGLVARELSATIKILLSCASGGLTDASKIIPSAHNGDRRRSDDVASIITSDSLAAIRKKFHVPNDVLIIAPKRTDRAHAPPQEFVAVYEMTMHAGFRFSPAPELLDIFKACGVALPQFLCRAITIIVGLIVFFREREGLTDASKIIPSAHDGDRRRSDDVASIITSDSLAAIRKKFHVPNDVLIIAPRRTNRAHAPPQRFVAVYEMTLCTGLRFPPAPEAITIVVGLIVFFRERGVTLTIEYLSKMCKFTSDSYGHISYRANKKWLEFITRDPLKNWCNSFFCEE
ncbi:hypothetical protein IEQ34_016047 [Dendrobium chrysotoxum]|uniref:Uncharacterized protein n=1 Tax=Dendrobium chrysotoxum TaxID=161865 RepID=A0AAV7GEE0_DENCH|nr:hypothetical protein IEQ34_016047 [Dendrobium chrysotoxum]